MKKFWNQRYAASPYAYGKEPNAFFKQVLDEIEPHGKMLLPAEGEGRNAVYAAKRGWEVDAIDFSEEGRNKALQWAKEQKVSINYRIQDLSFLPELAPTYSFIGLFYMHLAPELRETTHLKLIKALLPNGIIALEAFSKEQLPFQSGGPKKMDMLYDEKQLKEDFQGLDILLLEETAVFLDEGIYHQGEGRVVRMIAQKKAE